MHCSLVTDDWVTSLTDEEKNLRGLPRLERLGLIFGDSVLCALPDHLLSLATRNLDWYHAALPFF